MVCWVGRGRERGKEFRERDVREKRMRDLVAGEGDVVALQEAGAKHVAEGVVFFGEGEEGGGWDAWAGREVEVSLGCFVVRVY